MGNNSHCHRDEYHPLKVPPEKMREQKYHSKQKTANFGSSRDAIVAARVSALTRAGFPSSGAIRSFDAIIIFSLIFFFIFLFLLYFKGVSIFYTRI